MSALKSRSSAKVTATNQQVVALLSLTKELYQLKADLNTDYTDYQYHSKLSDFPQENPFIHLNYPLNTRNQLKDFPDSEEGRPCLMWIERPPVTPAPAMPEALQKWLKVPASWNNGKIANEDLPWHRFVIEFKDIPLVSEINGITGAHELNTLDFATFHANAERLRKALAQPLHFMPFLEKHDLYREVFFPEKLPKINALEYLPESVRPDIRLSSWLCFTDNEELIAQLREKLEQHAQDLAQLQALMPQAAAVLALPHLDGADRAEEEEEEEIEQPADDGIDLSELMMDAINAGDWGGRSANTNPDNPDAAAAAANKVVIPDYKRSVLRQTLFENLSKMDCTVTEMVQDAALMALLQQALQERTKWLKVRRVELEADKFYTELTAQFHELERNEEVECVTGTGLLHVQSGSEEVVDGVVVKKRGRRSKSNSILHPLLLRRVKLQQDATWGRGRIMLFDHDERCDLYSAILSSYTGRFNIKESEYQDEDLYPWDIERTSSFLRQLANKLSVSCYFTEDEPCKNVVNKYQDSQASEICNTPVLFVRKKKLSLSAVVDSMIEDVEAELEDFDAGNIDPEDSVVPIVVRDLVSQSSQSSFAAQSGFRAASQRKNIFDFENVAIESEWADSPESQAESYVAVEDIASLEGRTADPENSELVRSLNRLDGISSEVLLTKPANSEQLEIAESIEHASAVLVQGPPGTGKTHTIANLLGHFLAQGKTVLVISQNSKALRVLKDKVDENLRNLCISVLDDSNQDTLASMHNMLGRYSEFESNYQDWQEQIVRLKQERTQLGDQLCALRSQLEEQLGFENQLFKYQGRTYTTSELAEYVAEHEAEYSKLLPPITKVLPACPLTAEELEQLYASNVSLNPQLEEKLQQILPQKDSLISPQEMEQSLGLLANVNSRMQPLLGQLQRLRTGEAWALDFADQQIVFTQDMQEVVVPLVNFSMAKLQAIAKTLSPKWLQMENWAKQCMLVGMHAYKAQHGGGGAVGIADGGVGADVGADISAEVGTAELSQADFKRYQMLMRQIQSLCQLSARVSFELSTCNFVLQAQGMGDYPLLDQTFYNELKMLLLRFKEVLAPLSAPSRDQLMQAVAPYQREFGRLSGLLRVNNRVLMSTGDCNKALLWLDVELQREKCGQLWDFLIAPFGQPKFAQLDPQQHRPETMAQRKLTLMQQCLQWAPTYLAPLEQALSVCGLKLDILHKPDFSLTPQQDFGKLLFSCYKVLPLLLELIKMACSKWQQQRSLQQNLQALQVEYDNAAAALDKQQQEQLQNPQLNPVQKVQLETKLSQQRKAHLEIFTALLQALKKRELALYQKVFGYFASLLKMGPQHELRQQLLAKLQAHDPQWASLIESRQGMHGAGTPPPHILEAWNWRNLALAFDQFAQTSLTDVQREILEKGHAYRQLTAQYAAAKAWYAVLDRMDGNVVKALKQVAKLLKSIGNGNRQTKRMAGYKRDLKANLKICRDAIPVWIMPLNRVFENFTVDHKKFDMLIVDEASQVPIYGLATLFMAHKCIIVGDNKQVSPNIDVGLNIDLEKTVQAKYASLVPNISSFNMKESLYDVAEANYSSIMLKEHFRCVPEIINFSNALSYDMQIKVLRDASSSNLRPAILPYYVKDGSNLSRYSEKSRKHENYVEAIHIVALLLACFESPAYDGKTFGIITMLGQDQLKILESLILTYIDPKVQKERALLWGNAYNFQGDERDVIFISLVDSNESYGPLRLTNIENEAYKQSYNVAVSRARDQLWIVTSLDRDKDLQRQDIRYSLIAYAQNPARTLKQMSFNQKRIEELSDSPFEQEVAKFLVKKGYHITQQYPVGSYRIDIVVHYQDRKIALECDGDRYHSSTEQVARDLERQTILERLGWKFVRLRGSVFYRNKPQAMEEVMAQLQRLGIMPEYAETAELSEIEADQVSDTSADMTGDLVSDMSGDTAAEFAEDVDDVDDADDAYDDDVDADIDADDTEVGTDSTPNQSSKRTKRTKRHARHTAAYDPDTAHLRRKEDPSRDTPLRRQIEKRAAEILESLNDTKYEELKVRKKELRIAKIALASGQSEASGEGEAQVVDVDALGQANGAEQSLAPAPQADSPASEHTTAHAPQAADQKPVQTEAQDSEAKPAEPSGVAIEQAGASAVAQAEAPQSALVDTYTSELAASITTTTNAVPAITPAVLELENRGEGEIGSEHSERKVQSGTAVGDKPEYTELKVKHWIEAEVHDVEEAATEEAQVTTDSTPIALPAPSDPVSDGGAAGTTTTTTTSTEDSTSAPVTSAKAVSAGAVVPVAKKVHPLTQARKRPVADAVFAADMAAVEKIEQRNFKLVPRGTYPASNVLDFKRLPEQHQPYLEAYQGMLRRVLQFAEKNRLASTDRIGDQALLGLCIPDGLAFSVLKMIERGGLLFVPVVQTADAHHTWYYNLRPRSFYEFIRNVRLVREKTLQQKRQQQPSAAD